MNKLNMNEFAHYLGCFSHLMKTLCVWKLLKKHRDCVKVLFHAESIGKKLQKCISAERRAFSLRRRSFFFFTEGGCEAWG